MVHVCLNSRDFKSVMAVADIESPPDIVSHRIGCALLEFDEKYSSCQNGALVEGDEAFRTVVGAHFLVFPAILLFIPKNNTCNSLPGGCV